MPRNFNDYKREPLEAHKPTGYAYLDKIAQVMIGLTFDAAKNDHYETVRDLVADQPRRYRFEQIVIPAYYRYWPEFELLSGQESLCRLRKDLLENWLEKPIDKKKMGDAFTLDEVAEQLKQVFNLEYQEAMQRFYSKWWGSWRWLEGMKRKVDKNFASQLRKFYIDEALRNNADLIDAQQTMSALRHHIQQGNTDKIVDYKTAFNNKLSQLNTKISNQQHEVQQYSNGSQQKQQAQDQLDQLYWVRDLLKRSHAVLASYDKDHSKKNLQDPLTFSELQYTFNHCFDLVAEAKYKELCYKELSKRYAAYWDDDNQLVEFRGEEQIQDMIDRTMQYIRRKLGEMQRKSPLQIDNKTDLKAMLNICQQDVQRYKSYRDQKPLMDRHSDQITILNEEKQNLKTQLKESRFARFLSLVNALDNRSGQFFTSHNDARACLDRLDSPTNEDDYPLAQFVIQQCCSEFTEEPRQQELARIEQLLNEGLPVDSRDKNGEHLMHVSAYKSNGRLLPLLYFRGADVTPSHPKSQQDKPIQPLAFVNNCKDESFRDLLFRLTQVYQQDPELVFKLYHFSGEITDTVANYIAHDAMRGFWQRLFQTLRIYEQREKDCSHLSNIAADLVQLETLEDAYRQLAIIDNHSKQAARGLLRRSYLYDSMADDMQYFCQKLDQLMQPLNSAQKQAYIDKASKQDVNFKDSLQTQNDELQENNRLFEHWFKMQGLTPPTKAELEQFKEGRLARPEGVANNSGAANDAVQEQSDDRHKNNAANGLSTTSVSQLWPNDGQSANDEVRADGLTPQQTGF